jgi:hypothetical protein
LILRKHRDLHREPLLARTRSSPRNLYRRIKFTFLVYEKLKTSVGARFIAPYVPVSPFNMR